MPKEKKFRSMVFLWENFGPYHMDRVEAVHRHFRGRVETIGVELYAKSATYAWSADPTETFVKRTVFPERTRRSAVGRARRILAQLPPPRETLFFFCHYQDPAIFLTALLLRARGGRIVTMNDSKFDDKPRYLWREVAKSLFLLPYRGALSNGFRSKSYWQFLGLRQAAVQGEYNTVSLSRIRRQAGVAPAPNGPSFEDRHFTAIARLVPKKNLSMLLRAYAHYHGMVGSPRRLHLCGSGPEEASLRRQAAALGISSGVIFRGWLQDTEVSKTLGQSLALVLPSVEEQFGIVVIEAQAMGLPVVISDNCGARDLLVRSGVNGFVIEPDNPHGMAYFLTLLSEDQALWRRMCGEATSSAEMGDVGRFVEGVEALMGLFPDRVPLT